MSRRITMTVVGVALAASIVIGDDSKGGPGTSSRGVLPLAEGFEAGTVPPSGWELFISNAAYTWEATSAVAHSGSFAAQVPRDPDPFDFQNEYLLSPPMTLTEATLSFWSMGDVYWCRDVHNSCELFLWLVVGDVGGNDDILLGKADDDWIDTGVWSPSTLDLTPFLPSGGIPVRVAFNFMGWDEKEGVALDDILIVGESVPDPLIFWDDFETGDTSRWSSVAP